MGGTLTLAGLTLEENDRGLDPANGAELDTSITAFEDFEVVLGVFDLSGLDAADAIAIRGSGDVIAHLFGPGRCHCGNVIVCDDPRTQKSRGELMMRSCVVDFLQRQDLPSIHIPFQDEAKDR